MLISEQHIEGGEAADDFEVLEMIAYRQEGWQEAFTALYRRYEDVLITYYYGRTHDREAASDMAQSLWLTLIEKAADLSRGGQKGNVKNLLMNIARCQVVDRFRKEARERKYGVVSLDERGSVRAVADSVADPHPNALNRIAGQEIATIVTSVLGRYRKREQIVFRKMEEGCPAREVGRMVGYTEATVHKKYSLMRRDIRLALLKGGYTLLALLMFME